VERRLVPVNALLDLSLADGLNPAPLAAAGWQVKALEVPVRTSSDEVWVCDVVLFNESTGHLLAVEAKSGANIEPDQGRKLEVVDPVMLIEAGGITVTRDVPLRYEALYVCLEEHAERIAMGVSAAGLAVPVLAVGEGGARLIDPSLASAELVAALPGEVAWTHPIAEIIPFDQDSPDEAFDQPVRAELAAAMASGRSSITIRALTEQAVWHFAIYGQAARGRLVRKVRGAARSAAQAEPDRLRFEPATGTTEPRIVITRSAEQFDRRGRTQSYQAFFGGRTVRGRRPTHPDQGDLFAELDEAERVTAEEMGENIGVGSDELQDDLDSAGGLPPATPIGDSADTEADVP